ncbi:FecR family protein [Pedobacter sp. R20-19]|uniref:FecR family protein n=1 Tax=Pedobacter sp. R20-19 TaxID=1270196 RepID=UPI00049329F4|nr:FecR family protein [Pedobacter sp. R20-19]
MEQSTKQLFLNYIRNLTSQQENDQVLFMMQSGSYQEEWEQALIEFQSEFEHGEEETELANQQLIFQKIENRTALKKVKKPLHWIGYAASVVLIAAIAYLLLKPVSKPVIAAKNRTDEPAGKTLGHKWIKLPDGTSVQLNNDSRLVYDQDFKGKKKREVTLYGEAFFDVAHDAAHPFIIHTGKITTTVLGTAFNISAYDHQKAVTVTVTRGRVMIQQANKTLAVLTPNQQLSWKIGQKYQHKQTVNTEKFTAWKAQDLIMDDVTLLQASELIAKRYGIEVLFKSDKVKTCRFTAAFLNRNNITEVTEVLSAITGASFERKGNQLLIDGKGCEN